jgi:hypothetical protein
LFLVIAAAGAGMAELLDPDAGFDLKSFALFVGILTAVLLAAGLAGSSEQRFRRSRSLSTEGFVHAVPSGLAIAALCVVISRAVHFAPGYLFGLVGGLAFTVALDERDEGPNRLVACLVTLGVALLAWVAFGPVSTLAHHVDPSPFAIFADAVLAALFIGGVEGLLLGLVPLRALPGHDLFRWRRSVWAAVTFTVAFVFVQVVLRPSTGYLGHSTNASVLVTYGLFAAFGLASVAFWGWFQLHPDAPVEEQRLEAV